MQDSPNKSGISIIRVNNEKELQLHNLDAFAKDLFGHPAARFYPIYLIFYHGRLRGYFQAVQQLCVFPALHPDKMSAREFLKISRSLITEFKRMAGNPLFLLCPKAVALGEKNMHRIRLKKAEETVYVYDEKAP